MASDDPKTTRSRRARTTGAPDADPGTAPPSREPDAYITVATSHMGRPEAVSPAYPPGTTADDWAPMAPWRLRVATDATQVWERPVRRRRAPQA